MESSPDQTSHSHPKATTQPRFYQRGIWALIVLSLALRVVLAWRGGQYFNPDEDRYLTSKDAAQLIASGHILEGLAKPFLAGDHVGFKFIGVVPALIEKWTGDNSRIPALYFGAFSVLSLWLLGAIVRRLGGRESTALWAVLLGSASSTLFYYSRHILSYDAALAVALVGWYIGLKRPASLLRSALVGFICAWAFIIYFGYWSIGGIVMMLHVLWNFNGVVRLISTGVATGAGFGAGIIIPFVFNRLGRGHMVEGAKALSTTIVVGDFRGHIVPWEFLTITEHLWFFLCAASFIWLFFAWQRNNSANKPSRAAILQLVIAVLVTWACFLITANFLHKFVVHGRLIRQLTPFFAIAGAFALDAIGKSQRRLSVAQLGVLGVLIVDTAIRFWTPLKQDFPREFLKHGELVRAARPEKDSADAYWRYVNVENYVFEPELLRAKPLITALASPHPFEYLPQIYESHSIEDRKRRLAADHRMRLVYVSPPDSWKPVGAGSGPVEFELQFPTNRAGYAEPLLSVGTRGDADVFFVRYLAADKIVLAVERMNVAVLESEPISITPGKTYRVRCYTGRAIPPSERGKRRVLESTLRIYLDNNIVLDRHALLTASEQPLVIPGYNYGRAGSCFSEFSGEIIHASRLPLDTEISATDSAASDANGPAQVVIQLKGIPSAGQEPLMVTGIPGSAVLAFVRVADNKVVFGMEVWGVGAVESKPFPAGKDRRFVVRLETAMLTKETGLSPSQRAKLSRQSRLFVDGVEVATVGHEGHFRTDEPFTFGKNVVGGSYVSADLNCATLISSERAGSETFHQ